MDVVPWETRTAWVWVPRDTRTWIWAISGLQIACVISRAVHSSNNRINITHFVQLLLDRIVVFALEEAHCRRSQHLLVVLVERWEWLDSRRDVGTELWNSARRTDVVNFRARVCPYERVFLRDKKNTCSFPLNKIRYLVHAVRAGLKFTSLDKNISNFSA